MRLTLEVIEGPLAGLKSDLSEGQIAILGRADRSDFAIPHDRYVSGRHAMVECTRDGCRLLDLNSTNGTWLNGSRVVDAELLDGDMILAGRTVFRVTIQSDRDPDSASPQPVVMQTVNASALPPKSSSRDGDQSSIRDRIKKEDVRRTGEDESTDRFPADAIPLINPPTHSLQGSETPRN